MMYPNLFVIGAPKSGTTTLFEIFKQCNDIYTPKVKEIHFFSRSLVEDSYYSVSIPDGVENYLSLYNGANGEKFLLDCSPSYLYSRDAADEISDLGREVKVVIMLRDPVARSVSHYAMDLSKGFVNVPLNEILNNPNAYPKHYYQYVELSKYESHVALWAEKVGGNNLFFIFMDEMREAPQKVLANLSGFLGVEISEFSGDHLISNAAFMPKNRFIVWVRQNKLLFGIYHVMPAWLKRMVSQVVTKPMQSKPVDEDEKEKLAEILKDSVCYYQNLKG